ncbi:MAG: hypothetical protein QM650_17750 [Microlunatus sp.]
MPNLTEIEAAHLRAPRSLWRQSRLTRSRLGAVEAYEAKLDQLVFSDSKISYLNARGSVWSDVLVQHCAIDELDLTGCTISNEQLYDLSGALAAQLGINVARG